MDRRIVYPGSIPLDIDILQPQQSMMVALGYAMQATFGISTLFDGLACVPTSPPSMSVQVGAGSVISLQPVEATPFGSIVSDTTDQTMKIGVNLTPTTFSFTAPTTAGQSQCYLIQGSFLEQDTNPTVLSYYNSANPAIPFSGPNNSATPQNTVRKQSVALLVKVGTAATTGSQTIPPADAGWFGLWVITVSTGQVSILSSSIALAANAPFTGGKIGGFAPINSPVFTGVPQAPTPASSDNTTRIATMAAVQAVTSLLAPLISPAFTGTPTAPTPTAGDTTTKLATMAALQIALAPYAARGGMQQITGGTQNFTVPASITSLMVTGIAPGGSGGGSFSNAGALLSGGGGSSGQWILRSRVSVTPGQVISVAAPAGPSGGSGTTASGGTAVGGSDGAAATFGSFITLNGGKAGGPASAATAGSAGAAATGANGIGSMAGQIGQGTTSPTTTNGAFHGGRGGSSPFGDFGRGGDGGIAGRSSGTTDVANPGVAAGAAVWWIEW